jgi:hypothetical protein
MHSLNVLIARNERAAGREAGHAVNDGHQDASQVLDTYRLTGRTNPTAAFSAAYRSSRQEG